MAATRSIEIPYSIRRPGCANRGTMLERRNDHVKFLPAVAAGGVGAATCAAGMDSPGKGIFFPHLELLMESVQHSAARGSAAGGRTMTGRAPHETGVAGSTRVRRARFGREPAGRRPPEAESVGSGVPCRNRPGDTGRRRPQDRARGPLRGGAGSFGAAGRIQRPCPARTKPCVTTVCADFRALRHRSARCSIALDNCRYQP